MISDDSGTDFLLVKIVVVAIVASLLLVILLSGLAGFIGTSSSNGARAEARKISEYARLAYLTGTIDEPADSAIQVSIPDSVSLIAFGAMPANGSLSRMDRCYFIRYADGREETFVTDTPFACDGSSGPEDSPVLLYPGRYSITVRPVGLNEGVKAALSVEVA